MAAVASNSPLLRSSKKTVNDFKFLKEVGCGSYSTVFLAIETSSNREFAIKAVRKDLITRTKKTSQVFREKDILARLTDCPYSVKLYCTFQDERTLYFALTYCPNGDLLQYINQPEYRSEEVTRFYAFELVQALEHLQERRIIHRDLKPENILLTDDMHIQLTDFGSAVIVDSTHSQREKSSTLDDEKKLLKRTNSFVGTAQFVAPEILKRGAIHIGSDLWSLGCIIYQMVTGKHLFAGSYEYDIYNAVVNARFSLPSDFSPLIGDLIEKLLRLEPSERLGSEESGGMERLKSHPFFLEHEPDEKSPLIDRPKFSSRPNLTPEEFEKISPGFDARVEARLIGLRIASDGVNNEFHHEVPSQSTRNSLNNSFAPVTARRAQSTDHSLSLAEQAAKNAFHKFVQNNLIIRQGLLDKKKGLFARRRMFLITEGPAIYYVDPESMELKGTISWTEDLRIEQKDMKTFLIHVPGRTYHLTDPEQDAHTWCQSLISIHYRYYSTDPTRKLSASTTYSSSSSSSLQPAVPVTEL